MVFFKKLRNLRFWRKSGKRERKHRSSMENVDRNIVEHLNQVDTRNEAVDNNFVPHIEEDVVKKGVTFSEVVETYLVEYTEVEDMTNDFQIRFEEETKSNEIIETEIDNKLKNNDDVVTNIQKHTEEELGNKGEISNEQVEPNFEEGYEELKKMLHERDCLIASLQNKLKEKELEMDEMEAAFRSKLEDKERGQLEMTPRSELEEKMELEKKDENYTEKEQVEALRNQMEEMKSKVEATEGRCKELATLIKSHTEKEEKIQEQINIYRIERRDFKKVEWALSGQVNQLEKIISGIQLNQTGTDEDDEEELRRKFEDLRDEEYDLEEMGGTCEKIRYIFNQLMAANEIWLFVFVLSIFNHYICKIFGVSC